jgi:hypothetical protein
MENNEIWKNVAGYEDTYEVSSLGNIRRKVKNLKQSISPHGYKTISLSKGGKTSTKMTHRLVAEAFICNSEDKKQVNHIDCDKCNNCINNLEWATREENMLHAVKNDRQRNQNGINNNMAKLTEKDVIFIRKMLESGITAYSIHRDYYPNLHMQTIYGIKQRKLWNHI